MQQESNAKNSKVSKISVESLGSNLSNFSFLKDVPIANRESYRDSLKFYMSVESDKKSDIYEKLIAEEVNRNSIHGSAIASKPQFTNSYANLRESYDERKAGQYFNSSDYEIKKSLPHSNISRDNIKQSVSNYQLMHTCLCFQKCDKECPCFSATTDECLIMMCCPNCIDQKNKVLYGNKEKYQESEVEIMDLSKPCTCKKTKCNKKYCACYAAGKKCTSLCTCDDCANCEFYEYKPPAQTKPLTYIDEQYQSKNMPQKMDFQPCEFPEL